MRGNDYYNSGFDKVNLIFDVFISLILYVLILWSIIKLRIKRIKLNK